MDINIIQSINSFFYLRLIVNPHLFIYAIDSLHYYIVLIILLKDIANINLFCYLRSKVIIFIFLNNIILF